MQIGTPDIIISNTYGIFHIIKIDEVILWLSEKFEGFETVVEKRGGDEENVLTIWNQQIDKVISWLSHKLEWFEVHAKKRNDEEKNLLKIGDRQIDKVISWLSQKDEKEPFFLWLHLFDVHEAWTLRNIKGKPPAFHSRFRDDTFRRYIQEVYQPSSKYLQSRNCWRLYEIGTHVFINFSAVIFPFLL